VRRQAKARRRGVRNHEAFKLRKQQKANADLQQSLTLAR
jgi:hypothetical protein